MPRPTLFAALPASGIALWWYFVADGSGLQAVGLFVLIASVYYRLAELTNAVGASDLHKRVLALEARHDEDPFTGTTIVPHAKPLYQDEVEEFEKLARRLRDSDEP